MEAALVAILEPHVRSLLAEGASLDLAVRCARIRAFNNGSYAGEPCENCGDHQPGLYPWKRPTDGTVWNLCPTCGSLFHRKYPNAGGPPSAPEVDSHWQLAFQHLIDQAPTPPPPVGVPGFPDPHGDAYEPPEDAPPPAEFA